MGPNWRHGPVAGIGMLPTPNKGEEERKGGPRRQNTNVRPSLYTFSDACLHPPFVPTPVTPEAPALFHCLDKRPSHGLAWDVPAPAGSANNLWTHLIIRSSHCAYLIRRCPILVQARKGSTEPSPAPSGPQPPTQSSDLPQPLPQSELSNTLSLSECGYQQAWRSP